MEDQVYEDFAAAGRGLDEITKIALAGGNELAVFGYRLSRLSHRVYEVTSQMLTMLRKETIGPDAPRDSPGPVAASTDGKALGIGDQGTRVRTVQRGLRRAGQALVVDGYFLRGTWAAVCDFQRNHGLKPDGIVGHLTWAELPDAAPMSLLRIGSKGDIVADLQRVLTKEAPGRWDTTPTETTGTFGNSTSASVQAFQRWNGISPDGLVGDQTWAASIGESSLEDAVGLKYIAAAKV